jgi:Fe2+ or Zn2+ uptake regulation protein
MKGTDRRRELLAWLNENGSLSLTEIVSRFAISKMTAHRDLDILEKRHSLKRIHGGAITVTTNKDSSLGTMPPAPQKRDACSICHRPVGPHLLYSLTQMGGDQRHFCCPHCGVAAQLATTDQMVMAMATDFLSGQPHPAQQSWFVLGSDVVPCCRPSMLTFEDQSMAKRFQIGFGGRIGRLNDALDYLREEMSLHREGAGCPHCSSTHKR